MRNGKTAQTNSNRPEATMLDAYQTTQTVQTARHLEPTGTREISFTYNSRGEAIKAHEDDDALIAITEPNYWTAIATVEIPETVAAESTLWDATGRTALAPARRTEGPHQPRRPGRLEPLAEYKNRLSDDTIWVDAQGRVWDEIR